MVFFLSVTKEIRPPKREVFYFVAKLGFEPRQTEPESVVLPLHHLARFGYRQSNIGYR